MKYSIPGCFVVLAALCSKASPQEFSNFEDRIIDGTTIFIEDRPFMAAIIRDEATVCTGIIVTSFWVLTCAHCYNAKSGNTKDNTKVAVGSAKILENSVLIPVEKIVSHPLYSHTELYHDIAMVKTHEEIHMSPKVQPAVLAEGHDGTPGIGSLCQAIGFGSAGLADHKADYQLRSTTVQVITDKPCEDYFAIPSNNDWVPFIMRHMFCVRPVDDQVELAEGDAGGVYVCGGKVTGQITTAKERPSRIDDGPKYVAPLNDVGMYRLWIDKVVEEN